MSNSQNESSVGMVTISQAEYDRLCKDSEWLGCLEAAGVDNWEGFDEARRIRDENEST